MLVSVGKLFLCKFSCPRTRGRGGHSANPFITKFNKLLALIGKKNTENIYSALQDGRQFHFKRNFKTKGVRDRDLETNKQCQDDEGWFEMVEKNGICEKLRVLVESVIIKKLRRRRRMWRRQKRSRSCGGSITERSRSRSSNRTMSSSTSRKSRGGRCGGQNVGGRVR